MGDLAWGLQLLLEMDGWNFTQLLSDKHSACLPDICAWEFQLISLSVLAHREKKNNKRGSSQLLITVGW